MIDAGESPKLVVVSNVHKLSDCRVFHREAAFAAAAGYRVVMYAIDDGTEPEGVIARRYPAPATRLRRQWLGWRMMWAAYREGGDIYHFHDPELLLSMVCLRLLTWRPVIYDCHENVVDSIYFKPYIPAWLRPLMACCAFVVQWLCVRMLGRVVLATPEQSEMLPGRTATLVLRNFPPRGIQVASDPTSDRPYALVHCGGFSPERGSRVILQTMRILVHELGRKDAKLLLVGVARHDLDQEAAEFLRRERLDQHVEFRGYVPLSGVPRELARAKIGLMCHQPTRQYRYGVASKLFDYMAAGLAIIGGHADFDRDFAPEGEVKIYVDETNPAQYALAALELMIDDDRRIKMGRRARALFEEHYTAEEQAGQLLAFYQASLPGRAA